MIRIPTLKVCNNFWAGNYLKQYHAIPELNADALVCLAVKWVGWLGACAWWYEWLGWVKKK